MSKIQVLLFASFVLQTVLCLPNPRRFLNDVTKDSEELEDISVPYAFMFKHDDGRGTMQHREENKAKDGVIHGSYGYRDPSGTYRHVSYIADASGFHAVLRTNEPGIENMNSADVAVVVQ